MVPPPDEPVGEIEDISEAAEGEAAEGDGEVAEPGDGEPPPPEGLSKLEQLKWKKQTSDAVRTDPPYACRLPTVSPAPAAASCALWSI